MATVRVTRAGIVAAHRDAGVADPTLDHERIARTVQGIVRDAAGTAARRNHSPRTGSPPSTASIPRRAGHGFES